MGNVTPKYWSCDHRGEQNLRVDAILICSFTRCSGEPVPAAFSTLIPNGCHVPAA